MAKIKDSDFMRFNETTMATELSSYAVCLSPKKKGKKAESECIRFNTDEEFKEKLPLMIELFFADGMKRIDLNGNEVCRKSNDFWFVIIKV